MLTLPAGVSFYKTGKTPMCWSDWDCQFGEASCLAPATTDIGLCDQHYRAVIGGLPAKHFENDSPGSI